MASENLDEKAIFNIARQIDSPEARRKYLQQICGADNSLHAQVETLLKAYEDQASFLESPPPGVSPTIDQPITERPITERPGTQIGPYKLLQQLGEGGMGVVYMAEQKEPVKRRVALKIIKPGMDTRQVIARFEAERQALAMMDHPNIAKVLDAGATESGRPYFVMELVNGLPVTKYCDEQHLTPKERLELFVPICQAVQHAHQKGIIHRDLKPSNILVALYDGQPVPKVIDFGVAKATSQTLTEKTMFTQLGQVVGTLEYMSPEQAERNQLDIDTRSDIYSLGVVLYELLTGDTPFDRTRLRSAAFDEMLRIIREEEPSKPSTKVSSSEALPSIAANRRTDARKLGSAIRGELDWIVMKALAKDRARRYETASKFAEDVQHYLNSEPVVACPPSRIYLLKKFANRNRRALCVAAALLALLMMGIAGTSWQAIRATQAKITAINSEQLATANLNLALEAVDQMLTRVGDEKLRDVPYVEGMRRELLEDALAFYLRFLEQQPGDLRVRMESALAYRRVGQINLLLGSRSKAQQSTQQAIDILKSLPRSADSKSKVLRELANAHFLMGQIVRHEGALKTARSEYEQGVAILRLLTLETDKPDLQVDLAVAQVSLALVLSKQGQLRESEDMIAEAERSYQQGARSGEIDAERQLTWAKSLINVGVVFESVGDLTKAQHAFEQALAIGNSQMDARPLDSGVIAAMAHNNLARQFVDRQEPKQAFIHYDAAIAGMQKIAHDFPSVPVFQMRLAGILMTAGAHSAKIGRPEQGFVFLEQAIQTLQGLTDRYPKHVEAQHLLGGALSNLGWLLAEQGSDLNRAEQLCLRAVQHQSKALKAAPQNPTPKIFLMNHYNALAQVRIRAGRTQAAVQACTEALGIGEELLNELPGNAVLVRAIDDIRNLKTALASRQE